MAVLLNIAGWLSKQDNLTKSIGANSGHVAHPMGHRDQVHTYLGLL